MYTTNNEQQGVAALNRLEQVRSFFGESNDVPVQIVAFQSAKEFNPYRFNQGAIAYYLRSRKMDYIVMQDIKPEHYATAVHEYAHLVMEHQNVKLPLWLSEGLADLSGSLVSGANEAMAGQVMVLHSQRWLDLPGLFAVKQSSPYYNESDKMPIFYSESSALTQMLALGSGYRVDFARFLAAVASGQSAAECLQTIYGKTLWQVTMDLHAYLKEASLQANSFNVTLPPADHEMKIAKASPLSVELILTDLLASQKSTLAQASKRLSKLAARHPECAEVQESLGYVAWDEGDQVRARQSFKLAQDGGSENAQMLVQYAQLLRASGAPVEQMLPTLRRAVAVKPDNQDAWFNLGMTETAAHHFEEALKAFGHLTSVTAEHAYSLFSTQAYCYLKTNAAASARMHAEKAKQYASTSDEQYRLSNLLRVVDSIEQPALR
jgi:Tfp pilus assembly protein PilF